MEPGLEARLARRRAILDRIRAILIEVLDVQREPDEIDPDTPLFGAGLALDSIDAVDLAIHLKTEFGIEVIEDEGARGQLRTVNALVDLALSAVEKADGAA
ncbi:MAG: acyl carrier protein [Gammaproteobacteria bacterium]|nr:acyl carrier protein [Gemmatimonadota bacterium]NIR37182.1 acyl carrier protein [Actinomycetota bacterium]NIU75061.1 acyl carrier protein [Gammaproteobacteria bacterium]